MPSPTKDQKISTLKELLKTEKFLKLLSIYKQIILYIESRIKLKQQNLIKLIQVSLAIQEENPFSQEQTHSTMGKLLKIHFYKRCKK